MAIFTMAFDPLLELIGENADEFGGTDKFGSHVFAKVKLQEFLFCCEHEIANTALTACVDGHLFVERR